MPDTPDLDEMARNYLDLWQEHLKTISQDGETMDVLARTVALMNSGAAAFTAGAKGYAPNNETTGADTQADNITRPKTAGASPEPAGPELAQCLERIAILEKRVADLEKFQPRKSKPKSRSSRKS